MTYEDFEQRQRKVETINKLLDKLNNMLNSVDEDERKQILIYMEYLEMEYRKLESEWLKSIEVGKHQEAYDIYITNILELANKYVKELVIRNG